MHARTKPSNMPRIFSSGLNSCYIKPLFQSKPIETSKLRLRSKTKTKTRSKSKTMATSRILLRNSCKPTYNYSSCSSSNIKRVRSESSNVKLDVEDLKKNIIFGNYGKNKLQVVAMKASNAATESVVISDSPTVGNRGISGFVANVYLSLYIILRKFLKRRSLSQKMQMFIEKFIFDCRFFTLLAIAGSLIGSVLCFLEGCFIVLETYLQYFYSLSHKSDQGHLMHLLIEGIAMLIFGVGLYTMFVGHSSKTINVKGSSLSGSNLFGLFHMKSPPTWVGMQSVSQAKSKLGHAVTMILQVGLLEKFKSIPLATPLDLACFAGAVFVSSACIFLLSRLSTSSFGR